MIIIRRWIKNWKNIIKDSLSIAGFLWLITEMVDYFFPTFFNDVNLKNIFFIYIGVSVVVGLLYNFPKHSVKKKIRNRDCWIKLKIGDVFKCKGAIIVPINKDLDVSLNGHVKKAKSIQSRLLSEFYDSKESHLESDIGAKVDISQRPFPMGTVVEITQKERKFYLLVNSSTNQCQRAYSGLDDFMYSVNGMWKFLSVSADKDESVIMPLINTQHGRNPDLTREFVVKHIIDTFIESTKHKTVCDNLVIVIHSSDIEKGNLSFEHLLKYLEFQCENYKDVKFDAKPVGKEIEASNISNIIT